MPEMKSLKEALKNADEIYYSFPKWKRECFMIEKDTTKEAESKSKGDLLDELARVWMKFDVLFQGDQVVASISESNAREIIASIDKAAAEIKRLRKNVISVDGVDSLTTGSSWKDHEESKSEPDLLDEIEGRFGRSYMGSEDYTGYIDKLLVKAAAELKRLRKEKQLAYKEGFRLGKYAMRGVDG